LIACPSSLPTGVPYVPSTIIMLPYAVDPVHPARMNYRTNHDSSDPGRPRL